MSRADAPVAFWRCEKCGTPNPQAGYLTHCVACGTPRSAAARVAPARGDVRPSRPRLGRLTIAASWSYVAVLVGLIVLIAVAGERWWPTTFVLFAPRWPVLLPLGVLLPLAVLSRRRATLWPLLVATALAVGPWMGFCVPLHLPGRSASPPLLTLRVMTCNVERGRAVGLAALIESTAPDVVLMQETPGPGVWTSRLLAGPGWHVSYQGGLAIASRLPIVESETRSLAKPAWAGGWIRRFELATSVGPIHVYCVHLETPREGLEAVIRGGRGGIPALRDNMEQRSREADTASRWVAQSSAPFLVAGDFNMPTDSPIYRRYWSSWINAFAESGFGLGHSKFTRWFGIRIDHILAGPGWRSRRCRVGPAVGSDHRPVIADLEWAPL